jgi:hypothetical protein
MVTSMSTRPDRAHRDEGGGREGGNCRPATDAVN